MADISNADIEKLMGAIHGLRADLTDFKQAVDTLRKTVISGGKTTTYNNREEVEYEIDVQKDAANAHGDKVGIYIGGFIATYLTLIPNLYTHSLPDIGYLGLLFFLVFFGYKSYSHHKRRVASRAAARLLMGIILLKTHSLPVTIHKSSCGAWIIA